MNEEQEITTFSFDKDFDDIEEPELLPTEWYNGELAQTPRIMKNNVLYNLTTEESTEDEIEQILQDNPKAGYNMVISFAVEHADPSFNGREIPAWIPFPHRVDLDKTDNRGNLMYDVKMDRIVQFVSAFSGEFESDKRTFYLRKGAKGCCYVTQGRPPGREEMMNSIDIFAGFKEYGA